MEIVLTVVISMAFGAFAVWVMTRKSNVNPPSGGGGSTSDSDRLNKREK